jgi:hypothetical protein
MIFRPALCVLMGLFAFKIGISQETKFDFSFEISNVQNGYNSVVLPGEVYDNTKYDLSDIRIYNISKTDTLEIPYFITKQIENEENYYSFKVLNKAKIGSDYSFVLEKSNNQVINQISLDINNNNYFWNVNLYGTNELSNWESIITDYRIGSFQKKNTANFTYTTLEFSPCNYKYYKVVILESEEVKINGSSYKYVPTDSSKVEIYTAITKQIIDKENKTTILDIKLNHKYPIDKFYLEINKKADYYRAFELQYLVDSIQTEKGWYYNYKNFNNGIISSLRNNEFNTKTIITNKLRLIIYNNDNPPLDIDSIQISGYSKKLIFQGVKNDKYQLVFGNKSLTRPIYDLDYFANKLSEKVNEAKLINPVSLKENEEISETTMKKFYLWILLFGIIIFLGYFTLRMLNKEGISII